MVIYMEVEERIKQADEEPINPIEFIATIIVNGWLIIGLCVLLCLLISQCSNHPALN